MSQVASSPDQVAPSASTEPAQVEPNTSQTPCEEPRITAKEKNGKKHPGRVAAGKRLTQYSKEARERKKREEEEEAAKSDGSSSSFYVIAPVAVVASIAILAYNLKDKLSFPKTEKKVAQRASPPPSPPQRARRTTRLASG